MSINNQHCGRFAAFNTRREFLRKAGAGLGLLAFGDLLGAQGLAAAERQNPLALKPSHFAPKAKSVIWLFMEGGPSGFDLFDPKPELNKRHGERLDGIDPFFGAPGPILKSPYAFKQYGESGAWVSEAMPHITSCVDDIAFIKACTTNSNSHAPAMYQMNTGLTRPGFPSAGAWTSYGLGSGNQNMPGFVVMPKSNGTKGGALNWGAGFLPGAYQGTLFRSGRNPILNLQRADGVTDAQQRAQLDLMASLNDDHRLTHPGETDLEARIASYELAYRMQFEATDAVELSKESEATKRLYGIDQKESNDYGTKLLLARRLVERGVRFVQCYPNEQWDAHKDLKDNHDTMCRMTDQPVAGLLKDLKARGLLETTLVVWGGEFGRLPVSEKGKGRDHNPYGFLMWMAGGGIKGGTSFGETDEFGYKAAIDATEVPDIHATMLHLLGMDHEQLTFRHQGRKFRLTDVSGEVLTKILV